MVLVGVLASSHSLPIEPITSGAWGMSLVRSIRSSSSFSAFDGMRADEAAERLGLVIAAQFSVAL